MQLVGIERGGDVGASRELRLAQAAYQSGEVEVFRRKGELHGIAAHFARPVRAGLADPRSAVAAPGSLKLMWVDQSLSVHLQISPKERFPSERIQVLGETEISFLNHLTEEERRNALEVFFSFDIPAVFITKGQTPPTPLLDLAVEHAVLGSPDLAHPAGGDAAGQLVAVAVVVRTHWFITASITRLAMGAARPLPEIASRDTPASSISTATATSGSSAGAKETNQA